MSAETARPAPRRGLDGPVNGPPRQDGESNHDYNVRARVTLKARAEAEAASRAEEEARTADAVEFFRKIRPRPESKVPDSIREYRDRWFPRPGGG